MVNKECLQFLQLLASSSSFPCPRLACPGFSEWWDTVRHSETVLKWDDSKILTGQAQVSYEDHHDPTHVLLPVCPHPHASQPSENQRLILQDHWSAISLLKHFLGEQQVSIFFLVLHPLRPSVMASNHCAAVLCLSESFFKGCCPSVQTLCLEMRHLLMPIYPVFSTEMQLMLVELL